jgi:hypothetical protein
MYIHKCHIKRSILAINFQISTLNEHLGSHKQLHGKVYISIILHSPWRGFKPTIFCCVPNAGTYLVFQSITQNYLASNNHHHNAFDFMPGAGYHFKIGAAC